MGLEHVALRVFHSSTCQCHKLHFALVWAAIAQVAHDTCPRVVLDDDAVANHVSDAGVIRHGATIYHRNGFRYCRGV